MEGAELARDHLSLRGVRFLRVGGRLTHTHESDRLIACPKDSKLF
jgi:hypothetical protein